MKELCGIFALEVCAYAVMSNHVQFSRADAPGKCAAGWSDEEVARRWFRFCPGRRGTRWGRVWNEARLAVVAGGCGEGEDVPGAFWGTWSWFMRGLSEQDCPSGANQEDSCAG